MGGIKCPIITNEVKQFAKALGETPEATASLIGIWQEKNNKTDIEYPTQEDLTSLKDTLRNSKKSYVRVVPRAFTPITNDERAGIEKEFTPNVRRDRVNLITRLFSQELNLLSKDHPDKTRMEVLAIYTPGVIYQMIEATYFENYYNKSFADKVSYEYKNLIDSIEDITDTYSNKEILEIATQKAISKTGKYKQVLNNFKALAEESSFYLRLTEGITMDLENNNPELKVISPIEENNDGTIVSPDNIEEKEEDYKEGWMVKYNQVSSFDSLNVKVRELLNNIVDVDHNGFMQEDDLGNIKFLEPDKVHGVLVNALSSSLNFNDFINNLTELSKRILWVEQIIELIDSSDMLTTQIFLDFRKTTLSYWTQRTTVDSNGRMSVKTINSNKGLAADQLLNEWKNNIESGTILNKILSIYDQHGNILINKLESTGVILKELLGEYTKLQTNEARVEYLLSDRNKNIIKELLQSIGVNTDINTIESLINNDLKGIRVILNGLFTILKKHPGIDPNINIVSYFSGVYNSIAEVLAKFISDTTEISFREGGKSLYANVLPSLLTDLVVNLSNHYNDAKRFEQYLKDNFQDDLFFFRKGVWRNEWLRLLALDQTYRSNLKHHVMVAFNGKKYKNWNDNEHTLVGINNYFAEPVREGEINYGWYAVPIQAEAEVAEFIRFIKYTDQTQFDENGIPQEISFKEALVPKFTELALQELTRMKIVKKRLSLITKGIIKPIKNYDSKNSSNFLFLPLLNTYTKNNKTLKQALAEVISEDNTTNLEDIISEYVRDILELGFSKELKIWEEQDLFEKNKQGILINLPFQGDSVIPSLEEYYWNSKFATSQILQLTIGDLAFFIDHIELQKRYKQTHAPTRKLNEDAKYNGEKIGKKTERAIYLRDEYRPSPVIDKIEEILKNNKSISNREREDILNKFKNINTTDSQSYRTLESYKDIKIMSGSEWNDHTEEVYNKLVNNEKLSIDDLDVSFQPIKPLYSGWTYKDSGLGDGSKIKVPLQHKNSESVLLATYDKLGNNIQSKSEKLRALHDFMIKHKIDVVHFESAVKVGLQGAIELPEKLPYYEGGKGSSYYDYITATLEKEILTEDGVENPDVVHTVSYEHYGIITPTPEHHNDTDFAIGSQLGKIALSNLTSNMEFNIHGKKYTTKEIIELYNDIRIENAISSTIEVNNIFLDERSLGKELHKSILGNKRYGYELIKAVSLDKDGHFELPLFSPIQSSKIEPLLTSIIRNLVVKQKTKGGSLIQVSSFGVHEDLNIVFEGEGMDKRIKYYECYMPFYTKKYFKDIIEPDGSIDINKIPDSLRRLIGYRVPIATKGFIAPLYIKGFLPPTSGGSILLPIEYVVITGTDFDVDKQYIMLPEFEVVEDDNNQKRLEKIEYDVNKPALEQSVKQRNNGLIDVLYELITNKDTSSQVLTPGDFETLKHSGRILETLKNVPIETLYSVLKVDNLEDIINGFNKLSNDEFNNVLKKLLSTIDTIDPLAPSTRTYFFSRNMAGVALIGIFANHLSNASNLQVMEHLSGESVITTNQNKFQIGSQKAAPLSAVFANKKLTVNIISESLNAAVDNIKDPILKDLNISPETADITAALLRMGFNDLSVILLLNQPSVLKLFKIVEKDKTRSKKAHIRALIKELQKLDPNYNTVGGDSDIKFKTPILKIGELVYGIVRNAKIKSNREVEVIDSEFIQGQIKALQFLFKFLPTAEELASVTQIFKSDTKNGAVKPTLHEMISQVLKLEDINENLINIPILKNVLSDNISPGKSINEIREIIYKSPLPLLEAFNVLGLLNTGNLINKYTPHNSTPFLGVLSKISSYSRYNSLSANILKGVFNDLFTYILSIHPQFGNQTIEGETYSTIEKSEYYLHLFPQYFQRIKNSYPEVANLGLIQALNVFPLKQGNIPTINLKSVGKISMINKEKLTRDWESLLYMPNNPVANQLAIDLAMYSYYKDGFSFNANSYAYLMPVSVVNSIPGYVETLRLLTDLMKRENRDDIFDLFAEQYVQKHLTNRQLVPMMRNDHTIPIFSEKGYVLDIIELSELTPDELKHPNNSMLIKDSSKLGTEYHMNAFSQYIAFKGRYEEYYYKFNPYEYNYERILPISTYMYGVTAEEVADLSTKITLYDSTVDEYSTDSRESLSDNTEIKEVEISTIQDVRKVRSDIFKQVFEDRLQIKLDEGNSPLSSFSPNEDFKDDSGKEICK